jgi:hypothetical protein
VWLPCGQWRRPTEASVAAGMAAIGVPLGDLLAKAVTILRIAAAAI